MSRIVGASGKTSYWRTARLTESDKGYARPTAQRPSFANSDLGQFGNRSLARRSVMVRIQIASDRCARESIGSTGRQSGGHALSCSCRDRISVSDDQSADNCEVCRPRPCAGLPVAGHLGPFRHAVAMSRTFCSSTLSSLVRLARGAPSLQARLLSAISAPLMPKYPGGGRGGRCAGVYRHPQMPLSTLA